MTPAQRLAMQEEVIPRDPRDWWTGEEIDHFISRWDRNGLPELTMVDAWGASVTFWTADVRQAAKMLGVETAEDGAFVLVKDPYQACFLQDDKGRRNA